MISSQYLLITSYHVRLYNLNGVLQGKMRLEGPAQLQKNKV